MFSNPASLRPASSSPPQQPTPIAYCVRGDTFPPQVGSPEWRPEWPPAGSPDSAGLPSGPPLPPIWLVSRVVSRVDSRVVSRVVSSVADPRANPLASPFSLLGVILLRCLSILLKSPKRVFKGSRREAGILGIRFRTVGIINGPGRPFSYTGVCEIIVAIDFVCGLPSRGPSLFQCCAHAAFECKRSAK